MSFNTKDIIEKYEYSPEKAACLSDFKVVDVLYRKLTGLVIIKAESASVLPFSIYNDCLDYFKQLGFDKVKLYIKAKDQELPIRDINLYLDGFRKMEDGFNNCVPVIANEGFDLSYDDKNEYEKDFDKIGRAHV